MLRCLFSKSADAGWYINIRAIVNCKPYQDAEGKERKDTKVVFNENIPVVDFKARWPDLLAHLTMLNSQEVEPANIYYGVNPRTNQSAASNKILDIAGYDGFYLDLDDNKSFTKLQRMIQVAFWTDYGLPPSILVESGRGYHAYWVFNGLLANKEWGQNVLRRMVMLSGCKDKGNTHDPTRVLRLPGFYNVKTWWTGDIPFCSLVQPENISADTNIYRYEPAGFEHGFPPSELANIETYHSRAGALDVNVPLAERVRIIAREATKFMWDQKAKQDGREVGVTFTDPAASVASQAAAAPVAAKEAEKLKLTLTVVPPIEHLPFKRHNGWMKKYCLRGLDGLNAEEIKKTEEQTGLTPFSGSELDYRVMYHLIALGYTEAAIIEFWMRNGIKLYRPSKIQKNPNYLKMTFANAFSAAEATLQQGRTQAKEAFLTLTPENQIELTHHGLVFRRSEDKHVLIFTGDLELIRRYHDESAETENEREWFDLNIKAFGPNGVITYEKLVPTNAFYTIDKFMEHICDHQARLITNRREELQCILSYLERRFHSVPTKRFTSKLTFKDDVYNFPQMKISADKIETKEDTLVNDIFAKRYPIYKWFQPNYYSEAQAQNFVRNNLNSLYTMHLPRLVASIIGLIGAAAVAVRFREAFPGQEFNLPTVNVRGSSSSGKSETVRALCRLCGAVGADYSQSTSTTLFAMQRHISSTTFLPVLIDEFKMNQEGTNSKALQIIRDIVRRNYSGETILRGRADTSLISFKLHAPIIIVGEHQFETAGDISETSRIVAVNTDTYETTTARKEQFAKVQAQRWEWLAPLFYQFVLRQDVNTLYALYNVIQKDMSAKLEKTMGDSVTRTAHNLAVIHLGCLLWDKFFKSLWPEAPDINVALNLEKCLVEETIRDNSENNHTFVTKQENGPAIVATNNEFFQMLTTIQEMDETGFKVEEVNSKTYLEKPETNELLVFLTSMHEKYRVYQRKFNRDAPPRSKMAALLHGMDARCSAWLTGANVVRWVNNKTHRCYVFNLRMLQDMKIWRAGPTLPPQEPDQSPGSGTIF
jgi:hypothetical protein